MEEKGLLLCKISVVSTGVLAPPIFVTKNALFETSNNDKKIDNDAERNNNAQSRLIDLKYLN